MKCRVCREPAIIDIRRHNANFCTEHFLRLCRDQTAKAIKEFDMLDEGDRVLVAVSGGKDSLALWDILIELGYQADGLYIGLGIGDYSDESGDFARDFARQRDLKLIEVDLLREYGYDVPHGSRAAKRAPCSACGLSKRHIFDKAALDGGYDALATGHNLDDEAAVLFGNTLRWQVDYLGRQHPVLPARSGFPKKIKPLIRLYEREMAAYCVLQNIDYILEECPMAVGNKHIAYKEALNQIELQSPGSKLDFVFGFFARAAERFASSDAAIDDVLAPCTTCGAPTPSGECAFCRLAERATAAQPVRLSPRREKTSVRSGPSTPSEPDRA